ncbi:MAG: M20/M25/M40 family metallo-hydrolase [Chloroflexota bacterium]|nr:MAG: M20/M25/M40 family metallo-hydrolase [Chloroflexota bacterium]
MTELLPLLKSLISTPGLSGYEATVRKVIENAWQPITDELSVSSLGSLHGLKKGFAAEPRPRILIATHMDAIGLMVTSVVDGFLRVTEIGGIDSRILPGQQVTIHGRRDIPGVIVQPPSHLVPEKARNGPVPYQYLMVDTGLKPQRVSQLVRTGDLVSFSQQPIQLQSGTLAGRSLDNRASVAALTMCLQELQSRRHSWDVWAVATIQEEEGFAGAKTSTFQLRPDLAVAVDVTWGRSPGTPEHKTFPLDKGPTLGWGPNVHPGLHKTFKQLAEQLEIPYAVEVMPRHSGTDAFAMQVATEGVASMVVSIPLRYMHTPVEMVALKDIQRTAHLLSEFISQLDADFIKNLSLEVAR